MRQYNSFLVEAQNQKKDYEGNRIKEDVVMAAGRMNPPTMLGHGKMLKKARSISDSIGEQSPADLKVLLSRTQDPKKNPLPFESKLYHANKMFPEMKDKFDENPKLRSFLNAATDYHRQGYKNLHLVGGADRQPMIDVLRKYNGQLYDFKNMYFHNAGERNESSQDPAEAMSASKLRRAALNNDFEGFKKGYITTDYFKDKDIKALFDDVQRYSASQRFESWEVDTKSNKEVLLEAYKNGYYIKKGDLIEHDITGLVGRVHRCGANHLICITEEGVMFKSFIHDANLI